VPAYIFKHAASSENKELTQKIVVSEPGIKQNLTFSCNTYKNSKISYDQMILSVKKEKR